MNPFDALSPTAWSGASLAGVMVYCFLAATLLPGGSEVVLFAYLRVTPEHLALTLFLVTVANTAGGMVSYCCGRFLPRARRIDSFATERLRRWGNPALMLAWVPWIGDLLCVAAGWLRLNWAACAGFMAAGKFLRYWLVAQTALAAG